jgi:hypothetical protein
MKSRNLRILYLEDVEDDAYLITGKSKPKKHG